MALHSSDVVEAAFSIIKNHNNIMIINNIKVWKIVYEYTVILNLYVIDTIIIIMYNYVVIRQLTRSSGNIV